MNEPTVEVEYFTDPICSWSWAMEPHVLRLRAALGSQANWVLRMVGMLDAQFSDPIQQVHLPAQWAPQWFEVSRRTIERDLILKCLLKDRCPKDHQFEPNPGRGNDQKPWAFPEIS